MAIRPKGWLLAGAGAAAFGLTAMAAGAAEAGFKEVDTFTGDPGGNFCSKITEPTCTLETLDGVKSAAILKLDLINPEDEGEIINENPDEIADFAEITINPLFSSIDGSEFSIQFDSDELSSGTWFYTPNQITDPGITGFYTKGGAPASGGGSVLYQNEAVAFAGVGNSSEFRVLGGKGLSNIVFFDSTTPIPLPAAAWMMIGGLGLIGGAVARNRRRAEATA